MYLLWSWFKEPPKQNDPVKKVSSKIILTSWEINIACVVALTSLGSSKIQNTWSSLRNCTRICGLFEAEMSQTETYTFAFWHFSGLWWQLVFTSDPLSRGGTKPTRSLFLWRPFMLMQLISQILWAWKFRDAKRSTRYGLVVWNILRPSVSHLLKTYGRIGKF